MYAWLVARQERHNSARRTLSMVASRAYAVTLPIEEVRRLGWDKGDTLIVRRLKQQIIIEKEKNKG